MKGGPIILIEDDIDDQDLFKEVVADLDLPNKLVIFNNTIKAFDYFKTTSEQPFIIFCDVNLPIQNGIEFKRNIDADPELRKKSIPFIFYSTSVHQDTINKVYTEMTVQGFFKKKEMYPEIRENIKLIFDYWMACKHPNTF